MLRHVYLIADSLDLQTEHNGMFSSLCSPFEISCEAWLGELERLHLKGERVAVSLNGEA